MRLRRRGLVLLRVLDEPALDIRQFLRGAIAIGKRAELALLCPVTGESIGLTVPELALTLTVPAHRWAAEEELASLDAATRERMNDLVQRGVLLSDPPPAGWKDVASSEEVLRKIGWEDVAAVYHSHSTWRGVVATDITRDHSEEAHRARLRELRRRRGEPPCHFVHREDAIDRISLRVPALDGPFFEALLARRTTRAYRSAESLPVSALELVLYSVFGTQGIKHFAEGMSAIKRTSPSGGALHPIEAYVLATNVEGLSSGLYHYETSAHALALLEAMDPSASRALATLFTAGQSYFAEAHALVIHVARFDRNFWKYARHRKAYKAVLMDSAHLSQTLYLTAAHLGLGAFYTAAINDSDIRHRLRLAPLREAAVGINGIGLPDDKRDRSSWPNPYWPSTIV